MPFAGDGYEDLLVCHAFSAAELHKNIQGSTFILVSEGTLIGTTPPTQMLGISWGDWDGDGGERLHPRHATIVSRS